MVTTSTPWPSPETDIAAETSNGFFAQLVNSVFEPGANHAAVMAMNVSFFLLLLVLFALAFLTNWNKHVLLLLVVTALLWGSMLWFIIEITKIPVRPDNMPIVDPPAPADRLEKKAAGVAEVSQSETKKDR